MNVGSGVSAVPWDALTIRVGSTRFCAALEVFGGVDDTTGSLEDLLEPQPNNDIDRDCWARHCLVVVEVRLLLRRESELW